MSLSAPHVFFNYRFYYYSPPLLLDLLELDLLEDFDELREELLLVEVLFEEEDRFEKLELFLEELLLVDIELFPLLLELLLFLFTP